MQFHLPALVIDKSFVLECGMVATARIQNPQSKSRFPNLLQFDTLINFRWESLLCSFLERDPPTCVLPGYTSPLTRNPETLAVSALG